MQQSHLVSVVMPVYNAHQYIAEAIGSILNQTYSHFELIIINDGSTDNTESIITSFSDPRIRYIKNPKNLGLSPTLMVGLQAARGIYIARMDADDLSHPQRLEKQVQFLDTHSDYGVVGCMYVVLDQQRKPYEIGGMDFRSDYEIKLSLFSNNVFVHGETMFRRELIEIYHLAYNPEYNPCEDYELWMQMSERTKFCILEDVLYYYMINPDSMSGTRWHEMLQMVKRIAHERQKRLGLPYIPFNQFITFYTEGRKKHDGTVVFEGQNIKRYHRVNYQEFLFRTGFVYLKLLNLQGLGFLLVSFFINPLNWFWKVYRMIFVTHPRLQKKTKKM